MQVANYPTLEIGPTPREVKTLRREILDFHLKLGEPVIWKHRWNLSDAEQGFAQICPYQDATYHRDKTDCTYCFGTGFLGGFADGVVIFATLADAPVDQLKISPQGYILYDKHLQFTAPWYPDMGDGDLIFKASFDSSTWTVLQTSDRFELNDVRPVTMRGPNFGSYTNYKLFKVQQSATIDRVPDRHVYYNVPIVFDYTIIPVVIPPIGAFREDYPTNFASVSYGLRMNGSGYISNAITSQGLKIFGGGTTVSTIVNLNMTAKDSGSVVTLP